MDEIVKKSQDLILGEIVKSAAENSEVKKAGAEIGQAALTVAKTINNALLPLAAINYACDKAKNYFQGKFQDDLKQVMASVPQENIREPKASIAGPALQGLAFCHEEENLKKMYLNLLASSMNKAKAQKAHPSFVEIIKQLESAEAHLLKGVLSKRTGLPIVELRLKYTSKTSWKTLYRHLVPIEENQQPVEDIEMPARIDNWVRLGLVDVDYSRHLSDEKAYSWVDKRPEFMRFQKDVNTAENTVTFNKGIMSVTAYGVQFSEAIDIFNL